MASVLSMIASLMQQQVERFHETPEAALTNAHEKGLD